jgi:tagatose-1,6-bisphosphate aldolase
MTETLTVGKWRGLQQCATSRGALAVLALDHRNNLRQALRPDDPASAPDEALSAFKREAIAALAPAATAVLLDPQFGAAQCIASDALPGKTGLLVAVEASGYSGDPADRRSGILPGWGVEKIRRMGASAVKLLVYYHPSSPAAVGMEAFVADVVRQCAAADIPLFLEILTYSPDPTIKKLPPEAVRPAVIESARRLVTPGVDVLKVEFPLDVTVEPDERVWAEACEALSAASRAPWVLLSASSSYDTFLRQVTVACRAGASGVAVGRAVWREATGLDGAQRRDFLNRTARERMARLTGLVDALARPWSDFYAAPAPDSTWYAGY